VLSLLLPHSVPLNGHKNTVEAVPRPHSYQCPAPRLQRPLDCPCWMCYTTRSSAGRVDYALQSQADQRCSAGHAARQRAHRVRMHA
jgi:hypothetical protein